MKSFILWFVGTLLSHLKHNWKSVSSLRTLHHAQNTGLLILLPLIATVFKTGRLLQNVLLELRQKTLSILNGEEVEWHFCHGNLKHIIAAFAQYAGTSFL